jgi:hypothetical protein
MNVCRDFGNGRNNIQEFSFWQEKNKRSETIQCDPGFSGARNERTIDRMKPGADSFWPGGTAATL